MAAAETKLDALVNAAARTPEASSRGLVSARTRNEPSHPEVYRPALLDKSLQHTPDFQHCRHIATQLLGTHAYYLFDHALYKRAWSDTGVHWHQDQAYLAFAQGVDHPLR